MFKFFSRVKWFIRYPHPVLGTDYYLKPFSTDTWFTILLLVITSNISAMIMQIIVKTFINRDTKRFLTDNIYLALEYFCNQNGGRDMRNISFKIMSIFLHVTSLFMMALYSGIITSFLAVETLPFSNLEQFFQNRRYKFASSFFSVSEAYFSVSFFFLISYQKITDILL